MPLTGTLKIISFPSPTLSLSLSFQTLKNLPFWQILPTAAFFRTDYMIPQTFTVTSEHIRFYF